MNNTAASRSVLTESSTTSTSGGDRRMAPPMVVGSSVATSASPFSSSSMANSISIPPQQEQHRHHSGHGHPHHHSSSNSQMSQSATTHHHRSGPATGSGSIASVSSGGTITNNNPSASAASKGRRLLIIRHGERVDFTFNISHESWVPRAFDSQGKYKRFNINMPRTLPARKDGFLAYTTDTPLTEIGYLQAKLTGRALKEAGTRPTHVYVSPAYRTIQTCVGVLKGMQSQSQNVSFNIEPGLFEWGAWFRPKLPTWMTADEYAAQGYPVNLHYKPVIARTEITASESLIDYYNRSNKVVQRVLERHTEDCVILLVAHGASLDTCTRQLCGGAPRNQQDFYSILHQTPYLAMASAMEDTASRSFHIVDPPILPFQHQGNASYDFRVLNAQHADKA